MNQKFLLPVIILCLIAQFSLAQDKKNTRFVLAPSGLNLRKTADPASEKVTRMDFTGKVELIAPAAKQDMVIDGLPGGMAQVKYNGQTGYAFDGYLGRYPYSEPRDNEETEVYFERYAEEIRSAGYNTLLETIHRDFGGYFQFERALVIEGGTIMDAFLIGRLIWEVPSKIAFPDLSNKLENVVVNPDKSEMIWTDELSAKRNSSGDLLEIYYYRRGEGGGRTVFVRPDEENEIGIRVAEIGIAD